MYRGIYLPSLGGKLQDERLEFAYLRYAHRQRQKTMILVNLADIYVKILLIYFDYQASPTGQTETEDVYKDYLISKAFFPTRESQQFLHIFHQMCVSSRCDYHRYCAECYLRHHPLMEMLRQQLLTLGCPLHMAFTFDTRLLFLWAKRPPLPKHWTKL